MNRRVFPEMVSEELSKARNGHAKLNSLHEGYSVILEELDEVWEEVKKKSSKRDLGHVLKELVQVSAMCQRLAEDCLYDQIVAAQA